MKMTPEQRACIDYGKALGALKQFRSDHWSWDCVNRLAMRHVWRDGDILGCETQDIVDQHTKLIRDAWQMLAVCRAWAPLERRECRTCRYHDEIRNFEICRDCTPGIHLENFCNWEPRKEGK